MMLSLSRFPSLSFLREVLAPVLARANAATPVTNGAQDYLDIVNISRGLSLRYIMIYMNAT